MSQYQRGDARPVMIPTPLATAVTQGGMVGVSGGNLVNASAESWVTDLATTRRNFVAKFAGLSAQTKPANGEAHGNAGINALKTRVNTGGVHVLTCNAGTYAIGTLVGPAKDVGNSLLNATVEIVTAEDQAIGRVVGREGVNPGSVEVEILSRVTSDSPVGSTLAKLSLTGLKTLAAAGRNGAGAITLTGAAVGDRVAIVFGAPTAGGALAAPAVGTFEASVTVADQVQQVSASNLSTNTYVFVLIPAAS